MPPSLSTLQAGARRLFQLRQPLAEYFRPDVDRSPELKDFFLQPGTLELENADTLRERSPASFRSGRLVLDWHCYMRLPSSVFEFKFCVKRESTRMKVS